MKREIYEAIIATLKDEPCIKHIDLWNRNVEFMEVDEMFEMPAVFIEIGDITWTPVKTGNGVGFNGNGTVNIHTVTPWRGSSAADCETRCETLEFFDIWAQIHPLLEGLSGVGFRNLSLRTTMTSHDHEDIVESVDVYSVKYYKPM